MASAFDLIDPYFRLCVNNAYKNIAFLSVCQLQKLGSLCQRCLPGNQINDTENLKCDWSNDVYILKPDGSLSLAS